MLPGPLHIKKCPQCDGLLAERKLASGNTFGAVFWTDGKMDAPMLPATPRFVRCPYCKTFLWLAQLEVVQTLEYPEQIPSDAIKPYEALELKDYFVALGTMDFSREEEKYLRIRAWWAGNDTMRGLKYMVHGLTDAVKENLLALYELLDVSQDEERIMMAEIMRELGEFEKAEELLTHAFSEEFSPVIETIQALIQHRDSRVATY